MWCAGVDSELGECGEVDFEDTKLKRGAGVGVATTDSFHHSTAAQKVSHRLGTVNRTHDHTSQCKYRPVVVVVER